MWILFEETENCILPVLDYSLEPIDGKYPQKIFISRTKMLLYVKFCMPKDSEYIVPLNPKLGKDYYE